MQQFIRICFSAALLLAVGTVKAQMAIEYSREAGVMPLLQKGDTLIKSQPTALYYSDAFSPQSADFRDAVWIEFVLNQLNLEALKGAWEVLYLIPENEEEVIIIARYNERLGYLRFIEVKDKTSKL